MEKVLVANRGEIARRVFRTLRELGIAGVAVYSDADADAPHVREADEAVRIGSAPSTESYLRGDRILEAARAVGADAVHPGYGFLAENADFAESCAAAGLVFVGPPPAAIRAMGDKIEAKALLADAGVPVIPGFAARDRADAAIGAAADDLGFPVLVKAAAGGGGKGMRIVRDPAALAEALASARREARGAFGDDALLVERYFEAPRHVEVQIFADGHGQVIHLGERECSIQRRFQKVIEEAPSPAVDGALRARMGAVAVAVGKAIGYVGAGTVEFILDASGDFYFLEVNTRLQVEHPVTEAVTGLDLVAWQIRVARGEALPVGQEGVRWTGHAVEARLYAEDPAQGFLPATGRVVLWSPPARPGLRLDSGVEAGTEVTVHYDPMLAKIIAAGDTRGEALQRLRRGLREFAVGGVATNRDFLLAVLEHPAFEAGEIDTHFVERHLPPGELALGPDDEARRALAVAAALHDHERRRAAGGPLPPSLPSGWRNNRWRPQEVGYRCGDEILTVRYVAQGDGAFDLQAEGADGTTEATVRIAAWGEGEIAFELGGVRRRFRVAQGGDRLCLHGPGGGADLIRVPRFEPPRAESLAGGCVAPMTGVVRQVCVSLGDRVEEGALLLVLEAMKMEHRLVAHARGTVSEVRVVAGDMVDPDQVLVVVEPED